jgi:hypothetical protein
MYLLLCAALLAAAHAPEGTWDCLSTTPDGPEVKWTLNLKEVNGKLTGTATSERGEDSIEDPKYDDGSLTFKVTHQGETYVVSLKFVDDHVEGDWKGGGASGTVKGSKKQ